MYTIQSNTLVDDLIYIKPTKTKFTSIKCLETWIVSAYIVKYKPFNVYK